VAAFPAFHTQSKKENKSSLHEKLFRCGGKKKMIAMGAQGGNARTTSGWNSAFDHDGDGDDDYDNDDDDVEARACEIVCANLHHNRLHLCRFTFQCLSTPLFRSLSIIIFSSSV